MISKVNRRKFIIYATTIPAYLFLGSNWLTAQKESLDLHLVNILKKRLDYLIINDTTLFEYAAAAIENGFYPNKLWKFRGSLYAKSRIFDWALEDYAELLAQHFLMSSDFFWNGADIQKEVTFRAYYSPLQQPCLNPFADLSFDE